MFSLITQYFFFVMLTFFCLFFLLVDLYFILIYFTWWRLHSCKDMHIYVFEGPVVEDI